MVTPELMTHGSTAPIYGHLNKMSPARASLYLIPVLCCSQGCLFDSQMDHLVDDFRIGYVNDSRSMNLYYRSQGVFHREVVVSVGHTEEYIIVVTNPQSGSLGSRGNRRQRLYYVINIDEYKTDPSQIDSRGVKRFESKEEFLRELKVRALERVPIRVLLRDQQL